MLFLQACIGAKPDNHQTIKKLHVRKSKNHLEQNNPSET